jgi:hypothetical protein
MNDGKRGPRPRHAHLAVFPSTNLGADTIPIAGGTGLGGSRTVPPPIYVHPYLPTQDKDPL